MFLGRIRKKVTFPENGHLQIWGLISLVGRPGKARYCPERVSPRYRPIDDCTYGTEAALIVGEIT